MLYAVMALLACTAQPAYAQRLSNAASATIVNQHFSTKEWREQAANAQAKDAAAYVQHDYQSQEKKRPCSGAEPKKTTTNAVNKRDDKQCLIVMIELQ